MVMDVADFSDKQDTSKAPMSDWLRQAIPQVVSRDPLLALEDAVMLMDIVIALSKKSITIKSIAENSFIGEWLKQAVKDNVGRDIKSVTHDIGILRELLLVNLVDCYRHGQLHGPDVEVRMEIILAMIRGVVDDTVFQHLTNIGAYVSAMAEGEDGGVSDLRECVAMERARGQNEMAEIVEHLSKLTADELHEQLLVISKRLLSVQKTSQ